MPEIQNVEIDFDVFPNNVVQIVTLALQESHPAFEGKAYPRQLRPTDPNPCIGVFPTLWTPDQDTLEIGHNPQWQPTVGSYSIVVQAMNKDSDKDVALARHSTIARIVRNTLYRDPSLRAMLSALTVVDGTVEESFRKFTVGTQRFMSNEISSQFVFLSVLDLSIETETR